MNRNMTANEVGLSAAYVFILLLLLAIIDIGFMWVLNSFMLDLFNWFNQQHILVEIGLIIIGGASLIMLVLQIFGTLANVLGYIIFRHFPTNGFTLTIGTIIGLGNTIFLIIKLWRLPTRWSFWVVIELLILSLVAWSFAAVTRTKKEYESIT